MSDKIDRRRFMKAASAGLLSALVLPAVLRAKASQRPNILIIMADDMGYSDAGCYGGEINTPNLDRLAANGLRFTQFYNCARCCPTRASLLTGQYPHQVGLTLNGRSLSTNGLTIAEALKQSGYNTAMVGKWHLSKTPILNDKKLHQKWLDHQHDPKRPFAPLETYPVNRGFDMHYGVIWGVINYFDPFSLVDGTEPVESVPEDYYFTDALNDKSVEYIRQMSKSDKPFFLYVAHCAPHWPIHARDEDIAKYENTYKGGWEKLRKDRYARQLKMGLVKKVNTPLPAVQDGGRKWERLSESEKEYEAKKMAVHAAMIDRLDQGVGQILDTLEQTGQLDNTIIFFLCDNGASPEVMRVPGYDRTAQTRDGRKVHYRDTPVELLGSQLSYTGIGVPWASASNTPFRYWKMESFEGGCHTPLIVHWPQGLGVKGGSTTDQVAHVMDIMPTCLDLSQTDYPKEYQGHTLTPTQGKSLTRVLQGQIRKGHDKIFFEHVKGRAVRMGNWKLVANTGTPGSWELYNVSADRTETVNLAEKYPDRVKAMTAEWRAWAKRVGLKIK